MDNRPDRRGQGLPPLASGKVMTYPEMNAQIVGLLRFSYNPTDHYAATRIEELEAEVAQLRARGGAEGEQASPEKEAVAMKIVVWHGEHRTLFYVVAEEEAVASFHSRQDAEAFVGAAAHGEEAT